MSAESEKLRFQVLLEEFLADREWQDELEVNTEDRSVTLRTSVTIGQHDGGLLIVEASDASEMVGVFFYLPFKCKETKLSEMKGLINDINLRRNYGCFQCFPDGRVRWMHRVDFEGSIPSVKAIHQMVGPGWSTAAYWADVIAAVALTKQSAEAALEEHDEEERRLEAAEDDGPSEL